MRLSGTDLLPAARCLLGRRPAPRRALLADFRDADGSAIDRGIALFFPAPHSFTGEDVLELQGHGGPVVMARLLQRVCELGVRLARPGEFSERAFLNGKIDLAQAEAVADLIDSASTRAARSAMRSLAGEFSRRLGMIDRQVLEARMHVEAAIDFADEDVDFLAEGEVAQRLDDLAASLAALHAESRRGRVLRDGFDVVIAGSPNAGKSSLMNRLLAENRAIVTDIPGTTRDLLSADIEVDGVPVRLTDTAGLRAGGDAVEVIGVARARSAAAKADLVLFVIDDSGTEGDAALAELAVPARQVLVVRNKIDLTGRAPGRVADGASAVCISALRGIGLDALRAAIVEAAGIAPQEGLYLARQRHLDAMASAERSVAAARQRTAEGLGDLAAEDLRQAHERLGEIVGATSADDLLGEIFRSFCIGK